MMDAAASAPPWIPEDDLLLKNAMEAGGSLEALAKGAVPFSRKFSVRELRERWYSLLYDADISAEASSRMWEFEGCKPNAASSNKSSNNSSNSRLGRSGASKKRKSESIRKHYYAMQKRLCTVNNSFHPNNSHRKEFFDTNFLYPPHGVVENGEGLEGDFGVGDDHNQQPLFLDCKGGGGVGGGARNGFHSIGNHGVEGVGVGKGYSNGFVKQVSLSPDNGLRKSDVFIRDMACGDLRTQGGDGLTGFGNGLDVEDIGPSHASADEPLWKTIEDVPAPEMPIDVSMGVNGEDAKKALAVPDDMDGENIGSSQYEAGHSEAILNDGEVGEEVNRSETILVGDYADIYLTNEDEVTFMDVNGRESVPVDKPSDETLKLIPLSSPKHVRVCDVPDSCQPQNVVSDSCRGFSDNVHAAEMDVDAKPFHSGPDVQHDVSCSEAKMPSSTSVPNPLTPELHGGLMICILNTEDPNIPDNDDIIFPTATVHAVVQPALGEASELASSTDKGKCDQQTTTMKKEEDSAQPFKVPRMVGLDIITESSPNLGIKAPYGDSNCLAAVSKHHKYVPSDPSQCRSAHAAAKSITNQELKEEETDAPFTAEELERLLTEPGPSKMTGAEPESNPSALDCEGSEDESDDDVNDDDADIPYFSDIETLILEMDLCPYDRDSYFSKEVSAYQDDDSRRKIIRQEQCFQASMQRHLSSKGALAVLYGDGVKEYIKKTEVILGRATEDNEVDIDLGKEGLHNKVSRRQALIKMERDGSFSLKNVGKSSIFKNGEEVATGQLVSLGSSDFVGIRAMSFIFEMNHKLVKQYLGKVDWSPEKGP